MHRFAELAQWSAEAALDALKEQEERVSQALQSSAATGLVRSLQSFRLQRAALAVGLFSIFEASVQEAPEEDGFRRVRRLLDREGSIELRLRFDQCLNAINALKHGYGKSHHALLQQTKLPFRVKRPDEGHFFEGDVSEISTLVEVDDAFVRHCVDVIGEVSVFLDRTSE